LSEDRALLLKRSLVEGSPYISSLVLLTTNGKPTVYVPENPLILTEIEDYARLIKILCEVFPNFYQIDITLPDYRHLIILRTDSGYLLCKTRQNPNLGRVYLVLHSLVYRLR